jgi:galactokinase
MNREVISGIFESRFSQSPEVIVVAPGRINLIGEHTDYNNGFVLPAAIEQAVWAAVSRNNGNGYHFYAAEYNSDFRTDKLSPATDAVHRWANYPMGALSELMVEGCETGGLNIAIGGNVPLGAGLSSSAALISAVIVATDELCGAGLSRPDMARIAQRAENNFVGMQCGIMDMFASLMGKKDHVLRLDCRNLEYSYSPFPDNEYRLLLLDSGVKHQLVDSEYNTRRKECEAGVQILRKSHPEVNSLRDATPEMVLEHAGEMPDKVFRRCLFVTEENNRVNAVCDALESGNMTLVGELMYQSNAGLRNLYEVCVDETNFLTDSMHGLACGARQMGGGFGGCTINLLKKSVPDEAVERVAAAYFERFGTKLRALPVKISDGAHIL